MQIGRFSLASNLVSLAAFSGLADDDLDIAIQRGQEIHQQFDRKFLQLVVREGCDFVLVDFKKICRLCLRQLARGDDVVDHQSEF